MKPAQTSKVKKLSFFDFLNSINEGSTTPDMFATDAGIEDRAYVAFMVNRGLSYFHDTCLLANEMNRHASIPPRAQYRFLKGTVRPRKRFSKWFKNQSSDDLELIKRAYGFSAQKARRALSILKPHELDAIRRFMDPGGNQGRDK